MQYFWIAVLAVGVVLLFLLQRYWFGKPDTSRAAALAAKYKHMTPTLLTQTPDNELVEAVVSNLLAKLDPKQPEPYQVIPALSRGRCAVYSVWLFLCELRHGTLESFIKSVNAGFAVLAADGLELFGDDAAAALLRQYLETTDPALIAQLEDAVNAADPSVAAVDYIRTNPDEFCDTTAATEEGAAR